VLVAKQRLAQADMVVERVVNQYRALLADRNVALLLGAGIVSEIGDWFNTVALISLAYGFGDGALGVGGMFAARMLTRLIFQGPAGAYVDRHAGRSLLFTNQLLMAVIASSFAILVMVPQLWLLYLLVIFLEAANCIARPAFMVELKFEAPEEQRSLANGALFASMTTAQLVGPVLGALVLGPFGAAVVFVINGLTFLGVATAVTQVSGGLKASRRVENPQMSSDSAGTGKSKPDVIGYRWLLSRQDLSLYMLVSLSLALLVQATITLFVVRALTLGLNDSGVGYFYAAVAIGSVSGSIVAGARAQHLAPLYPAALAMVLCAMALAVFGVAGTLLLSIGVLVVAGFSTDFYEVVGLTYFQNCLPDAVYARFLSLFLLALTAGGLVGAMAGPVLEQALGAGTSLVVLAAPGFALALILVAMSRTSMIAPSGDGN
jgi:MFS family permease